MTLDYYNTANSRPGVDVTRAGAFVRAFDSLVQQIEFSRRVSRLVVLEREMTDMIRFQQTWEATDRLVTAMHQALRSVISDIGIADR